MRDFGRREHRGPAPIRGPRRPHAMYEPRPRRRYRRRRRNGCYIATCVYGSYNCHEVWVLRRYRDEVLEENVLGRMFISIYYAISPTIVKLFGNTQWFKNIWLKFLDKKVEKLKQAGYSDSEYHGN